MSYRLKGFTLVEIMIVVSVIGILAVICVPAYTRARERSMTNRCLNSLKEINGAKDQYAFDHNNAPPDTLDDLVPVYLSRVPACAAGGSYTINGLGEDATCNIAGHQL